MNNKATWIALHAIKWTLLIVIIIVTSLSCGRNDHGRGKNCHRQEMPCRPHFDEQIRAANQIAH